MQLAPQVDDLRAGGSKVETIFPDSHSEQLFGTDAMDLSLRPAAARAGYGQGPALVARLTDFRHRGSWSKDRKCDQGPPAMGGP
jgi:NTE family protein